MPEKLDLAVPEKDFMAVITDNQEKAQDFLKIVNDRKMFQVIGKNKHIEAEAWQLLGAYFNVDINVSDPEIIKVGENWGFRCRCELIRNGQLFSSGTAFCMSNERFSKGKEVYAVASMCQTRSIGKAFRNRLGFIAKLVELEATPAEEMNGHGVAGNSPTPKKTPKQPPKKAQPFDPKKAIQKIADKVGWPFPDQLWPYLQKRFGIKTPDQLTRDMATEAWNEADKIKKEYIDVVFKVDTSPPKPEETPPY